MFYEKDAIDDVLKCPGCSLVFVEPFVLPCGQHLCGSCIESALDAKRTGLVCKWCTAAYHRVPGEEHGGQFPLSKVALKLLEKRPSEVYRNQSVEQLKALLNALAESADTLARTKRHAQDTIREHCDTVRNEVQIQAELLVESVHKQRAAVMAEIETYELECLAKVSTWLSAHGSRLDKMRTDTERVVRDKSDYLKRPRIDDSVVAHSIVELQRLRPPLDEYQRHMRAQLFANRVLGFKANTDTLGQLTYTTSNDFNEMRTLDMAKSLPSAMYSMCHQIHVIESASASPPQLLVFYQCAPKDHVFVATVDATSGKLLKQRYIYWHAHVDHFPCSFFDTQSFLSCAHRSTVHCFVKYNPARHSVFFRCAPGILYRVKSFDADFSNMRTTSLAHELTALASNEAHVYGALGKIVHKFDKAMNAEASIEMVDPIERLVATDDRLFVLHTTKTLSILGTASHELEKKLVFKIAHSMRDIYFHLGAMLVMLNANTGVLHWYDLSGARHDTTVANCPPSLAIVNSMGGKLVFLQQDTRRLYFQS